MATVIGYHASHEQHPPSELLRTAVRAEAAGFGALMCSDHWAPWSVRQGHSGYAWSWLGAALHATTLPVGVVTAPGQRYHPAIAAQAIATLGEMFPGRFWAALGSGEAVNEHITGDPWPRKDARDERWEECAAIITRLLDGEEVSHTGHVVVDRARLWTRPTVAPRLLGAAVSATSARRAARWANGLITLWRPRAELSEVIDAFRGETTGPVYVQVHLSWAPTEGEALAAAHEQWRTNVFGPTLMWDLELPEQFDEAARHVLPDDVRHAVHVSADLGQQRAWIEEVLALGVDGIFLHHVGRDQERFIDVFGESVLGRLGDGIDS